MPDNLDEKFKWRPFVSINPIDFWIHKTMIDVEKDIRRDQSFDRSCKRDFEKNADYKRRKEANGWR